MTGAHVVPALLETAIARAHRDHERLHVVIPAVIPPALPISAMPDGLAERVNALRRAAIGAFTRLQARGLIEVVPTRDARSALLAAVTEVGRITSCSWAPPAGRCAGPRRASLLSR